MAVAKPEPKVPPKPVALSPEEQKQLDELKKQLAEVTAQENKNAALSEQVKTDLKNLAEQAQKNDLLPPQIAEQMKKRGNFRRMLKQRCEAAMQAGAKGIRIQVSGRLGGAEMSRKFVTREGSIPLSTLQANVDYALVESKTTYGIIGVKVWIYKGMYTDADEDPATTRAAGGRARARGRR